MTGSPCLFCAPWRRLRKSQNTGCRLDQGSPGTWQTRLPLPWTGFSLSKWALKLRPEEEVGAPRCNSTWAGVRVCVRACVPLALCACAVCFRGGNQSATKQWQLCEEKQLSNNVCNVGNSSDPFHAFTFILNEWLWRQ